jgi:hypothetical protein
MEISSGVDASKQIAAIQKTFCSDDGAPAVRLSSCLGNIAKDIVQPSQITYAAAPRMTPRNSSPRWTRNRKRKGVD